MILNMRGFKGYIIRIIRCYFISYKLKNMLIEPILIFERIVHFNNSSATIKCFFSLLV